MIQIETFRHAKEMARLPLGNSWKRAYLYWADTKRQWESAHNSAKITEIPGAMSAPKYSLFDLKRHLGPLSEDEEAFAQNVKSLFKDIASLNTTLDVTLDCDVDVYETILDMREISALKSAPAKVLDIGPGSGRNMLPFFLSEKFKGVSYVGVESIGLPYTLQNNVASLLRLRDPSIHFQEFIDYKFARQDFPMPTDLPDNSIWHLPLWEAEVLPEGKFDLIICNYVLDELPADDFHRVVDCISRCLAPDGILYCRGGQHRSQIADLYLYGYGTYHGIDITETLLSKGLVAKKAEIISGTLTRVFTNKEADVPAFENEYTEIVNDIPLVTKIQDDFIKGAIEKLVAADTPVVIWGDLGYADYSKFIAPNWNGLNIIGMTNRFVETKGATPFGFPEYPVQDIPDLNAACVIIASNRFHSYLRELYELVDNENLYQRVERFSLPIALIHRDMKD